MKISKYCTQKSVSVLHQLIEQNALLSPQAPAISCNGKTINYQKLNAKANQLARFLLSQGVGRETFVGIYLERSLEMIIAILATLKAGGTYIPIDAQYPDKRIHHMLSDSNCTILITQQSLQKKIVSHTLKKILLDANHGAIDTFVNTNLSLNTTVDNLAYVLYTSGSTGKPKGVMISHKSVMYAYRNWEKIYDLTSTDRHLQMANFSFDVFTGDLIRALGSGGELILCPREILLDPEKLYQLILSKKISCAEFVPTILRKLIEYIECNHKSLEFMRLLICGSDKWFFHEYKKLQQILGEHTRILNSYGVTEATIDSTYFEISKEDIGNFAINSTVPIGKPFPNIKIYLLNKTMEKVVDGEVGEIYISGPSLARGYLNKAELTKQKFIQYSFNEGITEKLYKTGDQGRYLNDGNIEFIGRIDSQVKLRGIRVELSDIECVLNSHSSVRESIVICHNEDAESSKLIAYVVLESNVNLNIPKIRKFLNERLPNYMIPVFFIQIDSLPLTPNGKIDRNALEVTNVCLPKKNHSPPTNDFEKRLVTLWQKLLKVNEIGVSDNFYDLGGDSVSLASLINQMKCVFSINISFCDIQYEDFTINYLASLIKKKTLQAMK